MPGFKDLLIEKGPQIAMMLLAAKQGGPQAVTGLMEGLQASQMRRQQQEDRAQQRMRQQTLDQQAQEDRAFRRSDIDADNARADMQFKQQQFEHALALMDQAAQMQGETAMDPAQAEAALRQQATGLGEQYSVPSERLMQATPPVAPLISGRKRKQAQAIYERAEKRFNPKGENPEWETSITLQTGELFGDITPADLRALFDAPAVDVSGAPALPPKAQRTLQILDLGGTKQVIDPTQLQPGMEFADVPGPPSGSQDIMNELRRMQIEEGRQKQADAQKADQVKRTVALQIADDMTAEIDKVLDPKTGQLTPGASAIVGWRVPGASFVPGSPAANAQAALDRVTSSLVVDLMREMKEQSRTGATGFGQLSERELSLLQSAASKLSNRNIGEAAFASELKRIRDRVSKIYQEQGGVASVADPTAAPGAPITVGKYKVTVK